MPERLNILAVCGRNKRRSKTAETIFRDHQAWNVRGVGLSPQSPSQISAGKLDWADVAVVMEDEHKRRIKQQFRQLDLPPIFVLHIDDIYDYMDAELIETLQIRVAEVVEFDL